MNPSDNQQPPVSQQTVVVQQAPSNGLGLAGFITSLVSLVLSCGFLSPVSLILSLIGLLKRPRGFAIAGSIISGLQLLVLLIIGVAPILAVFGIGAAVKKEKQELFEANKTEIIQTLRTTDDYQEIEQLSLEYFIISDEEFKDALDAAKERVPNPQTTDLPEQQPSL